MIPARAPRTFLDQIAEAWRTRPAGAWIGAAAAGFYQLLLWKLPMAGNTEVQTWHWAVANLLVIACLVGRRRWPLTVVALTGIASVLGQLLGAGAGLSMPLLIAVYALIATTGTGPVRCAIGLILATACDIVPGFLISSPFPLISRLVPAFLTIALVVTAALLSRSRRRTLEHRDAQLAARAAERRLAAQRDTARRQARVAGELHDSVGHDLTAIIALSEGLRGTSADPDLDEAIGTINALARDGLADTRKAVSALHPPPAVAGRAGSSRGQGSESRESRASQTSDDITDSIAYPADSSTGPRGWADIDSLLTTVRATGLSATLTETGHRPESPATGALVYTVAREALTNAMRHADGASRVVLSLDHTASATILTLTDDGRPALWEERPERPAGHGLAHLTGLIHEHGGSLTAGPIPEGGWRVHVTIPFQEPARA